MKDNWDKVKSVLEASILVAILVVIIVIIYKVVTKYKGPGETEILGADGRPMPSHLVALTASNAPRSLTITFVPVGPLATGQRPVQPTQQAPTAAEAA
jgi:hypothetical protein